MTTTITNPTTYSLGAYDADLKCIAPLSEGERRTLLACLPTTPSATALNSWTRGFLCGWCLAWHDQPFLDAEADGTLAAPVPQKRRKGDARFCPKVC
jgi:hypothetical protein